jgi:NTP pyrophosphatase (non-canonical NTP hydrolase)
MGNVEEKKPVINFQDMMEMQRELYEPHQGEWEPLAPPYARNRLLWMVEEVGECIAIIKKKGDAAIMEDQAVRENFCAEAADVLMYLNDVLISYGVSPEEISRAYVEKHAYNMRRNYNKQNEKLYTEKVLSERGK